MRPNHLIKSELENSLRTVYYWFKLDVNVRKERNAIFHVNTKPIYHVRWITRPNTSSTIVLKMNVSTCRDKHHFVYKWVVTHILYGHIEWLSPRLEPWCTWWSIESFGWINSDREVFGNIKCDILSCTQPRDLWRRIVVFCFNRYKLENNLVKLTDFDLTRQFYIYIWQVSVNQR